VTPAITSLYNIDTNVLNINFTSTKACSVNILDPIKWLENFKYYLGMLGLIIGMFLCFTGIKVFHPSLAIVGMFAGSFGTYILLRFIWHDIKDNYIWFVIIGICVIVGIVIAVLMFKIKVIGIVVSGMALGFVSSLWFYDLWLH
jgi:Domain of unknown function (DUF4203)